MKEMIKTLIDDGWEWVACDADRKKSIYLKKPHLNHCKDAFKPDYSAFTTIPSCLFPDITFENSPVELKTLLVDNEEEEQKAIKDLIEEDKDYMVRDVHNIVWVINKKENKAENYNSTKIIEHLCPNKYEKVYLKDLVKKRKVKKSLWVAVDKNGKTFIHTTKPKREDDEWFAEKGAFVDGLRFLPGTDLKWEDEPIELFYEVEE